MTSIETMWPVQTVTKCFRCQAGTFCIVGTPVSKSEGSIRKIMAVVVATMAAG